MDITSKIDKIANELKLIAAATERERKIVEDYSATLNTVVDKWREIPCDSALEIQTDDTMERMTRLRSKLSVVKFLAGRTAMNQINLFSDVDLFLKFVEDRRLFMIIEWVGLTKLVTKDMEEIIDPTIHGLSPDTPKVFSELLEWRPGDNATESDLLLFRYLGHAT